MKTRNKGMVNREKGMGIILFAITSSLFLLPSSLSAAVPLKWTVETSRATPAQFEAYQGETLDLEASLQSYGKPVELTGIAALYWQTNGMDSTYWEASAAVNSNRMSAVWTPEMDVGAKVYNCFIGQPGTIYHAAFQLRLRPSPGATPNVLPLPTPVIDFAKVRVLNPPWEGGGGGGVNTNAVIDIIHKTVDGAARPLPPYLHTIDFDDSYPDAAEEYYEYRRTAVALSGSCSAVRSGNFLSRNFDYPFDDRAEFVVKMSAGPGRFASIGVANVGTNLTESFVTSGKHSLLYKSLPGATVDGINENGVVAEINVVDGDPQTSGWHTTGDLHPLAAVRWALDRATNAQHAAEHLAANIRFPEGWQQNFHYMIADETSTYIVENGTAYPVPSALSPTGADQPVLTNFRLYPTHSTGEGQERYIALTNGANITSQLWTLTYTPTGYRASDLPGITGEDLTQLFDYWASKPREQHRGEAFHSSTSTSDFDSISWWQTVHTSVYDITNRVLRIAVQETDDWYVFALAKNGTDEAKVRELAGEVVAPVAAAVSGLQSSVSGLQSSKADKSTTYTKDDVDDMNRTIYEDMDAYDEDVKAELRGEIDDVRAEAETAFDEAYDARETAVSALTKAETLQSSKLDKSDVIDPASATDTGEAADALKVKEALAAKRDKTDLSYSGYTAWICDPPLPNGWHVKQIPDEDQFCVFDPSGQLSSLPKGNPTSTELSWTDEEWGTPDIAFGFTARRSLVTNGALATTSQVPAPYTPPPYLRVYDEVRQCWWLGRMVNGVINWEVE